MDGRGVPMTSRTWSILVGMSLVLGLAVLLWTDRPAVDSVTTTSTPVTCQLPLEDVVPLEESTREQAPDASSTAHAARAFVGRVEDVQGVPLAGVLVESIDPDSVERVVENAVRTLADGSFRVPTTRTHGGQLAFAASDHLGVVRDDVLPDVPIVVRLEPGLRVRGRVVDARTRAPIGKALVYRASVGGVVGSSVESDADGSFALVVRRFPAVLTANGAGYGESSTVVSDAHEFVELALSNGGTGKPLWVRVVDAETRSPVDDASIVPGPTQRVEPGLYVATTWAGMDQGGSIQVASPRHLTNFVDVRGGSGSSAMRPVDVALAPASRLVGRLVAVDGTGIENVRIDVELDRETGVVDMGAAFFGAQGTTRGDGRFVVDGVPIGVPLRLVATAGADDLAARDAIVVASRDPFDVGDVQAEDRPRWVVRVKRATDGAPVANAEVRVAVKRVVRSVLTDERGEATFGLSSRPSFVIARARGYGPTWRAIGDDDAAVVELALPRAGVLRGVVRDSSGASLSGASVRARLVEEPGDSPPSSIQAVRIAVANARFDPTVAEIAADAQGRFELVDLAPGTYELTGRHEYASERALGVNAASAVRARTDRDDVVVTLRSIGTLMLRVTSARSGERLDHIAFEARSDTGWGGSLQNTNGVTRLDVASGVPFHLTVSSSGFAARTFERLELAPREVRVLDVALIAESVVEGVARRADGTPAAGAELRFVANGEEAAVVHCASDGAFRVERLPSAEYRVTARLPLVGATDTFVPARIEPSTLVLGSGEARALDVRVDAGESGPLEFTIAVERASESAGVVESIGLGLYAREGDAWIAWNRVDAGSRLELPGLPAGVWDVRARLGIRLASGALRSVAATGSPADITVVAGGGATYALRLVEVADRR